MGFFWYQHYRIFHHIYTFFRYPYFAIFRWSERSTTIPAAYIQHRYYCFFFYLFFFMLALHLFSVPSLLVFYHTLSVHYLRLPPSLLPTRLPVLHLAVAAFVSCWISAVSCMYHILCAMTFKYGTSSGHCSRGYSFLTSKQALRPAPRAMISQSFGVSDPCSFLSLTRSNSICCFFSRRAAV